MKAIQLGTIFLTALLGLGCSRDNLIAPDGKHWVKMSAHGLAINDRDGTKIMHVGNKRPDSVAWRPDGTLVVSVDDALYAVDPGAKTKTVLPIPLRKNLAAGDDDRIAGWRNGAIEIWKGSKRTNLIAFRNPPEGMVFGSGDRFAYWTRQKVDLGSELDHATYTLGKVTGRSIRSVSPSVSGSWQIATSGPDSTNLDQEWEVFEGNDEGKTRRTDLDRLTHKRFGDYAFCLDVKLSPGREFAVAVAKLEGAELDLKRFITLARQAPNSQKLKDVEKRIKTTLWVAICRDGKFVTERKLDGFQEFQWTTAGEIATFDGKRITTFRP